MDDARELARLYFDDVFNHGNLAVVDRSVTPAFALLIPPSLGEGPQLEGREGFRQPCSAPGPRSRTCSSTCTRCRVDHRSYRRGLPPPSH